MTARPSVRARRRRYDELRAKGDEVSYEEILQNVLSRDKADMTRAISPLRKADDAVVLDNSCMTVAEQIGVVREGVPPRHRRRPVRWFWSNRTSLCAWRSTINRGSVSASCGLSTRPNGALADYGTVYSLGEHRPQPDPRVQRLEGLGLHTVTHADLDRSWGAGSSSSALTANPLRPFARARRGGRGGDRRDMSRGREIAGAGGGKRMPKWRSRAVRW